MFYSEKIKFIQTQAVSPIYMSRVHHRTHKVSKNESSTSADQRNNGEVETASLGDGSRHKPVHQSMDENERPSHYYESRESNPADAHLYNVCSDHYDRPQNLMKESGAYKNHHLSGNDKDSNQGNMETKQDPAAKSKIFMPESITHWCIYKLKVAL